MKVAVIGIGQLGSELIKVLGNRGIPIYHDMYPPKSCDIRYREMVFKTLEATKPSWVINTAAAARVDEYENRPDLALRTNSMGAYNVASVAKELGIGVVYISTNYVFGHDGPHREYDPPNPLSVYGVSKLAGEHCTMAYAPYWLIVRTSTMFGIGGKYNFVDTMLKQKGTIEVVDDLIMSPSYAKDVAEEIVRLIDDNYSGLIVHITNKGQCTFKEFAEEIFKQAGLDVEIKPCKAKDRDVAIRPRNGVLAGYFCRNMRPWQEALAEYLEKRKERHEISPR